MEQNRVAAKQVEADFPLGLGRVLITSRYWDGPTDIYGSSHEHRLELEVLAQPRNARACFPDLWSPSCFAQIGNVFFIPAEHRVHAKTDSGASSSIACIFDPAKVEAWFDNDLRWTSVRLQQGLNIVNSRIRSLMLRIKDEIRTPGFAAQSMIELMVAEVAIEASRHLTRLDERAPRGGLQAWRLRVIDERLADGGRPPALQELAGLCSMSVRHLTRAFRESRDISIGTYISQRRMDNAKRRLAAGECIKSVAFAMGYSAPSNFATAFQRVTGETPREYRQRDARRLDDRACRVHASPKRLR